MSFTTECHYPGCSVESHSAKRSLLNVILLNAVLLNIILLIAICLSAEYPEKCHSLLNVIILGVPLKGIMLKAVC
jgi:hypothetical protein